MEKDIPCKWKPKESRSSYTYTREIDLNTLIREKEGHYIIIKVRSKDKNLKAFSFKIRNKTRKPTLATFIQNSTEVPARAIRQEKEIKGIPTEKKAKTVSLCR